MRFPTDPNAPAPQRQHAEPVLTLASVTTRNFTFTALTADRTDALAALLAAWHRHVDECGADPYLMKQMIADEEVTLTEIRVGDCLRDDSVLFHLDPNTL